MRWTKVVGLLGAAAWLAACDGSDKGPNGPGGPGGNGGSLGAMPPCGGALRGVWGGSDPNAPPRQTAPTAAECFKLVLGTNPNGTLSARTWYPLPSFREMRLMFDDGGFFVYTMSARGPATLSYPAACLSKIGPAPPCFQLADALAESGLDEGSVRGVECTEGSLDGCDCTFDVWETYGPNGEWSVSGADLTLLVNPQSTATAKSVTVPFCVQGDTVRFGGTIEEALIGLSRVVLGRADCTDGQTGPGEEGIDCGIACNNFCP